MNTPFNILIVTLILTLIVFLIWNIILFNKKLKSKNDSNEYFELKYQLQFYVATFSVLIGVFSFLGYTSYNDIVEKVKYEISKETETIVNSSKKEIDSKILSTQNDLSKISFENERIRESNKDILENSEKTNDRFYKLYEQFLSLNRELYNSEKQLQSQIDNVNNAEKDVKNIKKDIAEINKIDFLKQLYLVTNISYQEPTYKDRTKKEYDTIYYKNLKTISGSDLPKFNTPPSIMISPYQGVQLSLKDVTNDYYTIFMSSKSGLGLEENERRGNKHKYDVLIIYKETLK